MEGGRGKISVGKVKKRQKKMSKGPLVDSIKNVRQAGAKKKEKGVKLSCESVFGWGHENGAITTRQRRKARKKTLYLKGGSRVGGGGSRTKAAQKKKKPGAHIGNKTGITGGSERMKN